jgi:hypothetical protein
MNLRVYFYGILNVLSCRRRQVLLALFCFAGALSGVYASRFTGAAFLPLTRMALLSPVSVVGLTACCSLPFLFAAFAVFISCRWLLYPLCFVKLFLHCWFGFSVMMAYGSSGWLLRLFLQFSDGCLIPVLCWFCLRQLSGEGDFLKRDLRLCLLAVLMAGIFDYCVITPFLASLIKI